ncbi:hypothetical protein O9929_21265 [Vibrio lentus]|nr:hypothetical protein [Vibrio lentus]
MASSLCCIRRTQIKFRNLTQLIGAAFIAVGDEKGIRLFTLMIDS